MASSGMLPGYRDPLPAWASRGWTAAVSWGGFLTPGLGESIRSRRVWGWHSGSQAWAPEQSPQKAVVFHLLGRFFSRMKGQESFHVLTLVPSVVCEALPARSSVVARPVVQGGSFPGRCHC